jgi:DNA end-binding protein Ku
VLLREALKKYNKVGVAKVIIRTKESLSLIIPHDHALLLYLIYFADDIRTEEEVNLPKEDIKTYKITDKEIKMAEALIKDMTKKWQPEKYHNEYRETMQKWLDQQTKKLKKSGKKVIRSATASNESMVDFISLLKDSMKKKDSVPKTTPATTKKKRS